ncbi:MAG: HNH endonuclease [Planctomycetes bacterium]|nr:HNH endonuclease [Planctomycetota bacterium]
MSIPKHIANELLAKCGRICCICRRFRPVHLQVHHIVEQSEGGSDEFDNLIALCINCHSDVHTTRPFTRRFTPDELKDHRDSVIRLVSEGKLVPSEDSIIDDAHILQAVKEYENTDLNEAARELLVAAVNDKGIICIFEGLNNAAVKAGSFSKENLSARECARYSAAVDELDEAGFVEACESQGKIWKITHSGYLKADELMALADDNNNSLVGSAVRT